MAYDYVTFQGKCKWAKVYVPSKFDKWDINVYLDATQIERFKSYKTKTYLRKDEDGDYVLFSRPLSKTIRGKVVGFAPPTVVDKEGRPTNVAIGNGSDVTVTCEKYDYTPPGGKEKLCAIRLFGVRIDNLIPFEKEMFPEEEQRKAAEVVENTPPAAPSW